jgi:hypothetical protein
MQKYQNNVTGRNGDVVIGGSVLVKLAGTATSATIYSDDGVTPVTNPLTTDANGYFEFYVADGLYDITVNGQDAYTSVLIVDALTGLAGRPTNSALAASGAAAAIGTTAGTVQSDINARPTTAALAAAGGSGLVGFEQTGGATSTVDEALNQVSGLGTTPRALGETVITTPAVDENIMVGGWGAWDAAAASKTRPAWDAIGGTAPGASTHDLELTGHTVDGALNSAVILGGRAAYYSYIGNKGSLTTTNGGDNYNGHLAGVILAYHCDLIDDNLGRGSHGCAVGGSFKRVSSDYAGTFAGTRHWVYGLQSVALGGQSIQIGNLTDSALVRRGGILGGLDLLMTAGYESVMLGGSGNTHTSGDRSAIVGGELGEMAASHAVLLGGQGNKATADSAVAVGRDVLADMQNTLVRSCGKFVTRGDNQVYDIVARRTFTGVTNFLSVSGGAGVDLFTPAANSTGTLDLRISCKRTDVVGETAQYRLLAGWSNTSGTLVITGQALTVIFESDAAYNVAAEIVGGSTRIGVRCTTPSAGHVTQWTAEGTLMAQF